MKSNLIAFITLMAFTLMSFTPSDKIQKCYISFQGYRALKAQTPDRLPESAEKVRTLKTNDGEVSITRLDGYRVLYK